MYARSCRHVRRAAECPNRLLDVGNPGKKIAQTVRGLGLGGEGGAELRLSTDAAQIEHELRAVLSATPGPQSCSTKARARSMPAVTPADV